MSERTQLLVPGETCWRIEQATRATVIIDADDYFRVARRAMVAATHQILLIGWDFDARIRLAGSEPPEDDGPETVGDFITWLIERTPTLHVYLLRWDVGAIKSLTRGKTAFTVLNWMRHDRIHTKLDGHHPTGGSHHQKIVVIDDCLAFCGGIDMTAGRWDTRAHRDDDPLRALPGGELYDPWHDATTALQGPIAAALGELSRERWALAGGDPVDPPPPAKGCWPDGLPVDFENLAVAIARTVPELDEQEPVHEIEALYLAAIASAKRFIYAESQYFASRRVAEAIARRLAETDGPEVIIVNPESADGWLEPMAMDTARARLVEALRKRDPHHRLRLYLPFTARGVAIYVHAKVLVVDDQLLRIGSSNFNNRSMRLDTECDVAFTAAGDTATAACIARIRDGLIAEHIDAAVEDVAAKIAETGSLIATIEALRGPGRTLRDYVVPELSAVEEWLADNEVLDPENPDDMFEVTSGGLLRGLARRVRGG